MASSQIVGKMDAQKLPNVPLQLKLLYASLDEEAEPLQLDPAEFSKLQEGENWPNTPLQEKFHRGILRGLRNIPDTP